MKWQRETINWSPLEKFRFGCAEALARDFFCFFCGGGFAEDPIDANDGMASAGKIKLTQATLINSTLTSLLTRRFRISIGTPFRTVDVWIPGGMSQCILSRRCAHIPFVDFCSEFLESLE